MWSRRRRRARSARSLGVTDEGVELRDPNDPPEYTRVGKPGEVPPGYHEMNDIHQAESEASRGDEMVEGDAGTVTPPLYRERHATGIQSPPPVVLPATAAVRPWIRARAGQR
jgi:hypothetical protein